MAKSKNISSHDFHDGFPAKYTGNIYFFYGDEAYQKEVLLRKVRKWYFKEGISDFDFERFYGGDTSAGTLLELIETRPFMAEQRVIEIRDIGSMRAKDLAQLTPSFKNPADHVVLLITCGKPDKRLGWVKALLKNGIAVECKPPRYAREVVSWLNRRARHAKKNLDHRAAELFASITEMNFQIISNEWEKLLLYTRDSADITEDDIMASVGMQKSQNVFNLQDALGNKKVSDAARIIDGMLSLDPKSQMLMTITMLSRFYQIVWRINALRAKRFNDREIETRFMPDVPFYKEKYFRAADNYPIPDVMKAFRALLNADIAAKSFDPKTVRTCGLVLVQELCLK
ncbi:MAG: DNA polymerase III subunit delta [Candidatus Cloacimonetes bacterium]|nr:DNA polymerase III subunit delta [Candidatus Cloacimonadota bacterium]